MRITVLTVLCLLFQQMALAAYACPVDAAQPPAVAGADCHGDAADPAVPASPLCQKHCAPDTSTAAEARSAGVPALALPAPVFPLLALQHRRDGTTPPQARSDLRAPPPALAYTRLLI